MSALARSLAIVTAMGLLGAAVAASEGSWPQLETPSGARITTVAGDLVLNGKPCRVVTNKKDGSNTGSSNSTTIITGQGGVSGSTTISPGGGNSSSVTTGSGSSSTGNRSSSSASSDCVIYRNEK